VINVGRPGDRQSRFVAALQSGHLGGGTRCLEVEPLPPNPLWEMTNVIVTPHSSGNTDLAIRRTLEVFTDNLGRYARGEPLVNEIT
jgi:phosphoglycerate dehydrogenase-like enzyme